MVALLAAIAVVPQQAAAKGQVPFSATITETSAAFPCGANLLCATIEGSGQASHLGRTSEASSVVVDLASAPTPGCNSETRTTTLTAANGDQITMRHTGQVCFGPTHGTATDSWVVTGGTGRFQGASGSGTNVASIDRLTGNAVTTYTGTLSSPGSLH